MMKVNKNRKINILKMLWERKYFYLVGYLVGIISALLSKALGSAVDIDQMVIVPISTSFIFGFIFYLFIKEPKRMKKEGRYILFSQEGLIHFALSFGSIIVIGLLYKILKYELAIIIH